jgi:hypothetical protein
MAWGGMPDSLLDAPYQEHCDREAEIETIYDDEVANRTWSEWLEWLDDVTDVMHLRLRRADGTYVSLTVPDHTGRMQQMDIMDYLEEHYGSESHDTERDWQEWLAWLNALKCEQTQKQIGRHFCETYGDDIALNLYEREHH